MRRHGVVGAVDESQMMGTCFGCSFQMKASRRQPLFSRSDMYHTYWFVPDRAKGESKVRQRKERRNVLVLVIIFHYVACTGPFAWLEPSPIQTHHASCRMNPASYHRFVAVSCGTQSKTWPSDLMYACIPKGRPTPDCGLCSHGEKIDYSF